MKSGNADYSPQIRAMRLRNTTHGHTINHERSEIYKRWMAMKSRCQCTSDARYHRYGGRGIKVCERWLKFENFLEDKGPTFKEQLSLNRIDNDGDYEPSNCNWITLKEQARNTSQNHFVEYNGARITAIELSVISGIRYPTLVHRLNRGLSVADAINPKRIGPPNQLLKDVDVAEILKCLSGQERGIGVKLAIRFGVTKSTISKINRGKSWRHLQNP